jgi:hypothetical protein
MDDKEIQKKNLEQIYSAGSHTPVFKNNQKHCIGNFASLTPYISYNDVITNKYIIRGRPIGMYGSFDAEAREVIAEYDSLESLVDDGWRLD